MSTKEKRLKIFSTGILAILTLNKQVHTPINHYLTHSSPGIDLIQNHSKKIVE